MDADATAYVNGLATCFADPHDPRVKGRCDHALLDILAIAFSRSSAVATTGRTSNCSPGSGRAG